MTDYDLDVSDCTVVAVCGCCDWRTLELEQETAKRAAEGHLTAAHWTPVQAGRAVQNAKRRAAS
jgi:hypothetical protein